MAINPAYQDVPFIASKIEKLKAIIRISRSCIATWKASEPTYYLLNQLKEQLTRNEKLLLEITGESLCQ